MGQDVGWCPRREAASLEEHVLVAVYSTAGMMLLAAPRVGAILLSLAALCEFAAAMASSHFCVDRPYWIDPSLTQSACLASWGGISPAVVALTAHLFFLSCIFPYRYSVVLLSALSFGVLCIVGISFTCTSLLWPADVVLSCIIGVTLGRSALFFLDASLPEVDVTLSSICALVAGLAIMLSGAIANSVAEEGNMDWALLHAGKGCVEGWGAVVRIPSYKSVARPASVVIGSAHLLFVGCPAGSGKVQLFTRFVHPRLPAVCIAMVLGTFVVTAAVDKIVRLLYTAEPNYGTLETTRLFASSLLNCTIWSGVARVWMGNTLFSERRS